MGDEYMKALTDDGQVPGEGIVVDESVMAGEKK
jgi:hypothetical protein